MNAIDASWLEKVEAELLAASRQNAEDRFRIEGAIAIVRRLREDCMGLEQKAVPVPDGAVSPSSATG